MTQKALKHFVHTRNHFKSDLKICQKSFFKNKKTMAGLSKELFSKKCWSERLTVITGGLTNFSYILENILCCCDLWLDHKYSRL